MPQTIPAKGCRLITRAQWEPLLLAELRRCGRFLVAVDFCGASLKTVRRHIVADRARYGDGHPSALGWKIREAKLEYAARVSARRVRRVRTVLVAVR